MIEAREFTCWECGGEGAEMGIESAHGCNGTEEDCYRICPVGFPANIPCEGCGGAGTVDAERFKNMVIHREDNLRAIEILDNLGL